MKHVRSLGVDDEFGRHSWEAVTYAAERLVAYRGERRRLIRLDVEELTQKGLSVIGCQRDEVSVGTQHASEGDCPGLGACGLGPVADRGSKEDGHIVGSGSLQE